MNTIYARPPLRVENGVPIFAAPDAYTDNYERIASDHLAAIGQGIANPFIEDAMWRELEDSTVALIERHAPAGGRLLDIGCGTGRLLDRLPRFERFGVDISLAYLGRLRERQIEAALARVEALPHADASFDVVSATDVLEHVIDLHAACLEMTRVLKPEGLCCVRVPYREDLAPYLAEGYPYRFAHLRSFDEHALKLLFCRVLDFDHLAAEFVHPLDAGYCRLPLPRGRGALTRALAWLERLTPAMVAGWRRRLYRPVVISMAFRKRAAHD